MLSMDAIASLLTPSIKNFKPIHPPQTLLSETNSGESGSRLATRGRGEFGDTST